MELTALLLSRLQFEFTVTFHIIFPSLHDWFVMWLTVLEFLHPSPAGRLPRRLRILVKIFGIAFGPVWCRGL